MQLKSFLCYLLLVNCLFSFGQKHEIQFKKIYFSKLKALPNSDLTIKASQFYFNNNLDSTLITTNKSLHTLTKNKELLNFTYLIRGLALREKNLFNEGEKTLKKIDPNFYFYPIVISSLGQIALEKNQVKESIAYFKKVENIQHPENYDLKISNIKHNIGIAYLLIKDFKNAEIYLLENSKIQEKEKDTIGMISSYGDLANLYYEQFKDNQAIPYFKKAYDLAKKTKDFESKATTAHNMSIVEENRKNFELANNYRKEHGIWKDSVNDKNKIWEVAQIEKQFAVKEKQKEVSLLQTENKLKIAERNGFLYSAIFLLVLLIASIYFYLEKSKKNRIISKQKEKLDELNATKDKLFSIVSHDLRSSVNALKNSTTKIIDNVNEEKWVEAASDLKQNSAIANSTYNLLDNLLHWALLQNKQSFFQLTPLKLYFITEQVSYNYQTLLLEKNLTFENSISKKATVFADQESIKIVLRNFLDNAIKFSNQNGTIKIYVIENNTYWDLIIEDNGKGMTDSIKNQLLNEEIQIAKKHNENTIGSGLGLQLCKSMIQKNKGKLNIESEVGKGTKMIVSLPKEEING